MQLEVQQTTEYTLKLSVGELILLRKLINRLSHVNIVDYNEGSEETDFKNKLRDTLPSLTELYKSLPHAHPEEHVRNTIVSPEDACLEELCATMLSHRDWHAMSSVCHEMVKRLEKGGFLRPCTGGFVGSPTRKVVS